MKFDIETYFYESLLINLDFALYSYYKRDFNAAFAHLFSCFKILLIISEKKFNLLIEKIHNAFVDLFSYLIEICSGYITYIYNNQGINQAQFFVIKLGNLLEKFLNWKVVVENKLLDGNFCFLKSLIDFYINSSIISLKPESSYKSIEICLEVLEKISKVKQQTILEEIDNKTMKLENSTVFKNILLIKNEYLNVTLNNFLQSLSICYVLAHNYTNEEK